MQQFQITSAGEPFWDRHCEIKFSMKGNCQKYKPPTVYKQMLTHS